jgi:hypothetical protein
LNELLNPPAIVREEFDVFHWHEEALGAANLRNLSNLKHAEALYYINKDNGYQKLGYETIQEYVYKNFDRSKQWATKLIDIHRKLVIELGVDQKRLQEATFGKVSKVIAHMNEENKDEILDAIKGMTQQQVGEYVKHLQGLNPLPEEEAEEIGTLKFKGPLTMIEVVDTALKAAKSEIYQTSTFYKEEKDVPDLLSLDFLASSFLAGFSLEGDPYETLDRAVKALEHNYNVSIKWETKND